MPVRTNSFQRLVALVQDVLAPRGARVTESAMVADACAQMREIDVLVEVQGCPLRMMIAVESKDHKRRMAINQFEEILGKYYVDGGVQIDQLVVVTHSGFAKTVIARAKRLNALGKSIRLQRFDEIDAECVGSWYGNLSHILVVEDLPEIHIQAIEPLPAGLSTLDLIRGAVVRCGGACHEGEPLRSYLTGYFYRSVCKCNAERIRILLQKSAAVRRPVIEQWVTKDGLGPAWKCGHQEGRIGRIHFLIRCTAKVGTIRFREWNLTSALDDASQSITVAEVPVGEETLRMVMRHPERDGHFPPSITMQFERDPGVNGIVTGSAQGRVTFCGLDGECNHRTTPRIADSDEKRQNPQA